MAALHEVQVAGLGDGLKSLFAAALWGWINDNGEQEVWRFSFKVFGMPISKTFRVKDLHVVFEKLLGPNPGMPVPS